MHAGALRALEYDRIVEAVRRFAQTPPGAARLAKLQPLVDARAVAGALAATAETSRFLRDGDDHAPGPRRSRRAPDVARGRGPRARTAGARQSGAISRLGRCHVRLGPEGPQRLSRCSPPSPRPRPRSSTRSATSGARSDPPAKSSTMPARSWRSLRDRLRKQRARLRGTLESYLRGRDTSKYLQQQIVTDRNGRYVLVVRSEHRTRHSRHRARQLGQRRQPVPRTPQHGRDQQRHRRARAAGIGGSPPDPAGARRCAAAASRRLAPHGRCGDRARRAAGAGALLAPRRRDPAGDWRATADWSCARARHPLLIPAVRRHLGDAADDGAAPAADSRGPGPGRRPRHPAGARAGSDRAEYRRQDRRTENGRAPAAAGAVGIARAGGRRHRRSRSFGRCSPTSATSNRSRRASAPSRATSPTSSPWTAR